MNLCFDICVGVAVLPKLTMQEIKLTQGEPEQGPELES